MNFDFTEEQQMVRETIARLLDENSSSVRVRAALPPGQEALAKRGARACPERVIEVVEE